MNALYTRETLKKKPADFRIGSIVSDGMWYTIMKWKRLAKVNDEEINTWINNHLADGSLIQSPTGAKSYRFPLSSIKKWYRDNGIELGVQLIDSIFPPRIWDNMTEAEGFLNAPLREIGMVSFSADSNIASKIADSLRGIAKIREFEPGRYKAFCLSASYVKEIVENELKKYKVEVTKKTYSRAEAKRREIVDFSPRFAESLVVFYKNFGKTLVKKEMETIKVFLPDPEDQDSQITLWVLTAIEKFDESASVPFSGYLNTALKHWPYDLPSTHLGKELSDFQRKRAKAIGNLQHREGDSASFSNQEIAEEMGKDIQKFNEMEERHRIWKGTRAATTLTWEENSDEKLVHRNISGDFSGIGNAPSDIELANKLSFAVIQAALNTNDYTDAFSIISQMDASELNMGRIKAISEPFIQELGLALGMDE